MPLVDVKITLEKIRRKHILWDEEIFFCFLKFFNAFFKQIYLKSVVIFKLQRKKSIEVGRLKNLSKLSNFLAFEARINKDHSTHKHTTIIT